MISIAPELYKGKSPEDRFWAKVNKTETCWLWTGARAGGRAAPGSTEGEAR